MPLRIPHRPDKRPEDGDPNGHLTMYQRGFIKAYVENPGISLGAAMKMAGMKSTAEKPSWFNHPKVQKAIALYREEFAKASQMTKKKVIDGFSEAIDIARIQGEPMVMVAGWREIGKMCGFYEPQKTKVEISVRGQVLIDRLQALSDEELLAMTEQEGKDAILGEFRDVSEGQETPEDPS